MTDVATTHSQNLYREMILEHSRKPRNYGKLPAATHSAEGYNPLCGDHIWIYLRDAEDRIVEARFDGDGCAICKASASLMTEILANKSHVEAEALFQAFHALITGRGSDHPIEEENLLGKLKAFAGVAQYPARVKCASLAWHTMKAALYGTNTTSTEHGS